MFTMVNSTKKKNLAESRDKRKWDVVQKKIKLSAKCRNKQKEGEWEGDEANMETTCK